MSMPTTTVPSSPEPTLQALVFSLLRSILMLAAALGIGIGAKINDGALMMISGAIVAIGTAAWEIYDKYRAASHAHATAVASAAAQAPVQPAR